jgi:nicotinate phosphoribosyltransferase
VLQEIRRGPGCAIRLDSGDLGELARRARATLDVAGLPEVRIVASGGLDEYAVAELVGSRAPIDVYAVGTKVGVAADAPYLDAAYKLVEYEGRPVMKLSSAKVTTPGRKQVFRRPGPSGTQPLLHTVMSEGRRTAPPDRWECARARLAHDIAALPASARKIDDPEPVHPLNSRALEDMTSRVRGEIESQFFPERLGVSRSGEHADRKAPPPP